MSTPSWHSFLGTWHGHGVGNYPHFGTFRYLERTQLSLEEEWGMAHILQRTWILDDKGEVRQPLHLEYGIIVPREDGTLELALCAPTKHDRADECPASIAPIRTVAMASASVGIFRIRPGISLTRNARIVAGRLSWARSTTPASTVS